MLRWIEVGQQLDPNLPLRHQPRMVAVLQVHTIIEAKEGKGLGILLRGFLRDQQGNQQ